MPNSAWDALSLAELAPNPKLSPSNSSLRSNGTPCINIAKRNSSQVEKHADGRVEQEGFILVQDVLRTQQLHLVHHRDAADGEETLQ